jgi:cobalt transporter subunit CbtB
LTGVHPSNNGFSESRVSPFNRGVSFQTEVFIMTMQSNDSTLVVSPRLATGELFDKGAAVGSKWPALFAAILGGVILFGVGFSNLSIAHNAAHDTRHAMVFPCH